MARPTAAGLTALLLAAIPVHDAYPGGRNLPQDLPAEEIRVGGLLDPAPAADFNVYGFGEPDGQEAVLIVEDYQLQLLTTLGGGNTWSSELIVAGAPDLPAVLPAPASTLVSDGKLYVAMLVAYHGEDVGIQFVKSDDMDSAGPCP